jgi:CHAD domain-containing protein
MGANRSQSTSVLWLRIARRVGRGRPRLAAGVIGAVGLGVGLALRKAELDRRSAAQVKRPLDQKFAPQRGESLAAALHRLVMSQLDVAIDSLSRVSDTGSTQAIHETRKAIKRVRVLLGLFRSELDAKHLQHWDSVLHDCAKRLAGARDSDVLMESLDAMIARHPRQLGDRASIEWLQRRLREERELTGRDIVLRTEALEALEQLRMTRERARGWRPREGEFEIVAGEVKRIYQGGQRAFRVARKSAGTAAMHDWRKRVKDLRYAAEALGPQNPTHAKDLKYMTRLARRSDRLAELLGEEHDLALLAERVRKQSSRFGSAKHTRKTLLRKIEQRREHLRAQALDLGKQLYDQPAKEFVRAVGRAQRRA